jgi:hypothetical protein
LLNIEAECPGGWKARTGSKMKTFNVEYDKDIDAIYILIWNAKAIRRWWKVFPALMTAVAKAIR